MSGSAGMDLNPISSHFFAIKDLKSALADFGPYKDLITINTFPCSAPNLGPALIQCFSRFSTYNNVFCTSAPIAPRLFKSAANSKILTEYLYNTLLYVIDAGVSTICPSETNLAFLLKFSDSFTSNIRLPVIS